MASHTIIDFLNNEVAAQEPSNAGCISFHMPGHKGRSSFYSRSGYENFVNRIMQCDITEIPGADALYCPETIIKGTMDNYADLYGVNHTELLVNGSSAGVMASIMGTVPIGGKLILQRNSHYSAFSALRLGAIMPVYIRPAIDESTGLVSEILPSEVERACKSNPDAHAIFITSPNYYGMMSDIAAIADIAHRYDMTLIVDQAHGAHLRFFDYYADSLRSAGAFVPFAKHSAESLGADIVINSTHKTLLSFTGSAIVNFCTDRVSSQSRGEFESSHAHQSYQLSVAIYLRMLQTTSPSYLLMGSLDANEKVMRQYGREIIAGWCEDLSWFYRNAAKVYGLSLVGVESRQRSEGADASIYAGFRERVGLDLTKINISMRELGLSGARLDRELRRRNIISEMVHGDYVMLMTGAGSIRSDYEQLLLALQDISRLYDLPHAKAASGISHASFTLDCADVPLEWESVPLYKADERILYDPLVIYPPGTPLACPGEILNVEAIAYIAQALSQGEKISGIDPEGNLRVAIQR